MRKEKRRSETRQIETQCPIAVAYLFVFCCICVIWNYEWAEFKGFTNVFMFHGLFSVIDIFRLCAITLTLVQNRSLYFIGYTAI